MNFHKIEKYYNPDVFWLCLCAITVGLSAAIVAITSSLIIAISGLGGNAPELYTIPPILLGLVINYKKARYVLYFFIALTLIAYLSWQIAPITRIAGSIFLDYYPIEWSIILLIPARWIISLILKKKNFANYIAAIIIFDITLFLCFTIMWFSHSLSGYLFFKSQNTTRFSTWGFSLLYNLTYVYVGYLFAVIIANIIFINLHKKDFELAKQSFLEHKKKLSQNQDPKTK